MDFTEFNQQLEEGKLLYIPEYTIDIWRIETIFPEHMDIIKRTPSSKMMILVPIKMSLIDEDVPHNQVFQLTKLVDSFDLLGMDCKILDTDGGKYGQH